MKYRIIAIFLLIFSLNANSYYPIFLAQKHLDRSSEKLIIEINSVSSEIIYPDMKYPKEYLNCYDVKLSAKVQFVGQTDNDLREGDIICFSYTTTQYKPNVPQQLCGHQPLPIPKEQNLCIAYLNKEGDNYKLKDRTWSLQFVDDVYRTLKHFPSEDVPDWVKLGINKIVTAVE